jgi:hypothetical protein
MGIIQVRPTEWLSGSQLVDVLRFEHQSQWIGIVGKILTGNPWVFAIKLNGVSCKKKSHHPIMTAQAKRIEPMEFHSHGVKSA